MNRKIILLVEDNPDDEALALRAFKKNNILNEVVVARDSGEVVFTASTLPGAATVEEDEQRQASTSSLISIE